MKLAQWLKEKTLTHVDFAARIGASQVAVTRYANGLRIPRPKQMAAIARETEGEVTSADFYGHAATSPSTQPDASDLAANDVEGCS